MGGKGGDQSSRLTGGYSRGYEAYRPGVDPTDLGINTGSPSDLETAWLQGFKQANSDANYTPPSMPVFDFGQFSQQSSEDYQAQLAEQQAAAEKEAGVAQIQDLYSKKFDAAEQATSDINTQIAEEKARAQLVGLDYSMDDATKQKRINDVFAGYWGEGDESSLSDLVSKFGDAGYTWDLPIVRGTPSETSGEVTSGASAGKQVKAKGPKTTTVSDPLNTTSVLG